MKIKEKSKFLHTKKSRNIEVFLTVLLPDLLPKFCGKTAKRVLKNAKKRRKNGKNHTIFAVLAEKEGFEPSLRFKPYYSLSRGAP